MGMPEGIEIKKDSIIILGEEITRADFPQDFDRIFQLAMSNPDFLISLIRARIKEKEESRRLLFS